MAMKCKIYWLADVQGVYIYHDPEGKPEMSIFTYTAMRNCTNKKFRNAIKLI